MLALTPMVLGLIVSAAENPGARLTRHLQSRRLLANVDRRLRVLRELMQDCQLL